MKLGHPLLCRSQVLLACAFLLVIGYAICIKIGGHVLGGSFQRGIRLVSLLTGEAFKGQGHSTWACMPRPSLATSRKPHVHACHGPCLQPVAFFGAWDTVSALGLICLQAPAP